MAPHAHELSGVSHMLELASVFALHYPVLHNLFSHHDVVF